MYRAPAGGKKQEKFGSAIKEARDHPCSISELRLQIRAVSGGCS